jgi:hypothetical protein
LIKKRIGGGFSQNYKKDKLIKNHRTINIEDVNMNPLDNFENLLINS